MDLRRSARPRVVKKRSDIIYLDDQRIELTDQEKDLIYPHENQKDKRYCFCKRTEEEAIGLTMIQCDACHDWFHDECLGRKSEELESLVVYYCPSCSNIKNARNKKPSNAELELLLAALAELDEEKPKNKKKEQKVQFPKISVYQLTETYNKLQNVSGFIRNESSSSIEDNKVLVPITKTDLDRGVVWTPWGSYKVSSLEGKILSRSEPTTHLMNRQKENPDSFQETCCRIDSDSRTCLITGPDDLTIELPRKNNRFQYDCEKSSGLLSMANCSSYEKFKDLSKSLFKNKLLKEVVYNS